MSRIFIKFFILVLFLCSFEVTNAQIYSNLKIGDISDSVLTLQKVLNLSPETEVSGSGAGSYGQETNYFGTLTFQAVKKFQEKYASEILTPFGLSSGTGYVGNLTLKKINSLLLENQNSQSDNFMNEVVEKTEEQNGIKIDFSQIEKESPKGVFSELFKKLPKVSLNLNEVKDKASQDLLPHFSNQVKVFNTLPFQVKPGDTITINGTGFSEKNTVFIGSTEIKDIPAKNSLEIVLQIPEQISLGKQKISVLNSQGDSRKQGFEVSFHITDNPKPAPVLESFSPEIIDLFDPDAEVVLKGKGLDSKNNYIVSPLGVLSGISGSENKLSFKIKGLSRRDLVVSKYQEIKDGKIKIGSEDKFPFSVFNEKGYSNFILLTFKVQ